jgi:hypothetical protein
MGKLCNLIDYHIKNFGVKPEGLSMIGAMATTFDKAFESRASKYWETAVVIGLQKVNEMATFKAALVCAGDFAIMMEGYSEKHASQFIQQIMVYIQKNFDRDIKLSIINCMDRLILSIQDFANSFADQIIEICDMSFAAVEKMSPKDQDLD